MCDHHLARPRTGRFDPGDRHGDYLQKGVGALAKSAPTVSVITISLNDLDGLKRTVSSVRAQRYGGSIEHIVIDGGSGAHVVDYLSSCKPGFTYWQSEPDGGIYDAMNQGIAHAAGDLLWFMNSGDCFSDADAVALVATAVSGNHEARDVWGYGMINVIGPDGGSLGCKGPLPFDIRSFLTRGKPVPHQAVFFGSSLVNKLGGYDVDFGLAADQLYIFRAALLRNPITIPRVLADFDGITGVGSRRPLSDHFRDLRRMSDIHRFYLLRGRRRSLTYMRCWEYWIRAKHTALVTRDYLLAHLGRRVSM